MNAIKVDLDRVSNEKSKRVQELSHIKGMRDNLIGAATVEGVELPTVKRRKRGKNSGKGSRKKRKINEEGDAVESGDDDDEDAEYKKEKVPTAWPLV
eukprot:TRINITY_DN4355_c0_g1_i1.p3 TRINITY_DN4355_c0_g1~~TRINITY_DN4355_c0_g1_i1.p3  ORF type:complete len:97 (+),score=36.89 TRINITY_DN4355_c0_g1_i1:1162-1452(+)